MAVSESRVRTSALTGTTTLPVSRKSRDKVTRAITAAASGRLPNSDALVSTSWADGPVTWTPNGAGRSRTAATRSSPAGELASTEGTTDSQGPGAGETPPPGGGGGGGAGVGGPGGRRPPA